ncbi:hypothetical protein HYPSUDRAFT_294076 [Hypholoma sublateritium FD-334 SS-4]|uniref:Uncharacterized protein n=1 Tax=Hypholoma sublateritium (strain FD-334 SS-4) TaxID=945553 RepID=A0A0D2NB50_HYPSF|nr:hypothetical protein HYPSUDRAFT_294076 [Hypholoma sublateritium FD-334 SS-4]
MPLLRLCDAACRSTLSGTRVQSVHEIALKMGPVWAEPAISIVLVVILPHAPPNKRHACHKVHGDCSIPLSSSPLQLPRCRSLDFSGTSVLYFCGESTRPRKRNQGRSSRMHKLFVALEEIDVEDISIFFPENLLERPISPTWRRHVISACTLSSQFFLCTVLLIQ